MLGIRPASFNVVAHVDEDTRIMTSERRASTKESEYLSVPAIMDTIAFCMKLSKIPQWPPSLIRVKILVCLGLSCVWPIKANNANMWMSFGAVSSLHNKDTNSSTNSSSLIKKTVRPSWSGLDSKNTMNARIHIYYFLKLRFTNALANWS